MLVKEFLSFLDVVDRDRIEVQYNNGLFLMSFQNNLDNDNIMNAEIKRIAFLQFENVFTCRIYTEENTNEKSDN